MCIEDEILAEEFNIRDSAAHDLIGHVTRMGAVKLSAPFEVVTRGESVRWVITVEQAPPPVQSIANKP